MSFARPQNPVLQVFDQAHLYEELEENAGRLYGSQTLIHYVVSNNGILELYNLRDGDVEALPSFADEGPSSGLRLKAFFLTLANDPDNLTRLNATPASINHLRTKFGLWDVLLYNYVSVSWSNLQDFCTCYKNDLNETVFETLFRFRFSPTTTDRIDVSFAQVLYNLDQNSLTYFFTNVPQSEAMGLITTINSCTTQPIPFLLETVLLQRALKSWESTVFSARNAYFAREIETMLPTADFATLTKDLHESRNSFTHFNGAFGDFEEKVQFLRDTYTRFSRQCLAISGPPWDRDAMQPVADGLSSLASQCKAQRRQVVTYSGRAEVYINLLLHLSTARAQETTQKIAATTAKLAESVQRDSTSQITIAALLMTFLPATFIAALFSMAFFRVVEEGNGVKWRAAENWWLFPAVAVPVTAGCVVGWWLWKKRRGETLSRKLQVIEKMELKRE